MPPESADVSPERMEVLIDFIDGRLDESETAIFEASLTENERREVELQRAVRSILDDAPAVKMTDIERAQLRTAIHDVAGTRSRRLAGLLPAWQGRVNWVALGSVAASLILVVAAATVLSNGVRFSDRDEGADAIAIAESAAPTTAPAAASTTTAMDTAGALNLESLQSIEEPAEESAADFSTLTMIRERDVLEVLDETPGPPRAYNPDNLECRDEIIDGEVVFGYLGAWTTDAGRRLDAVLFKVEDGRRTTVLILDTRDCSMVFELEN